MRVWVAVPRQAQRMVWLLPHQRRSLLWGLCTERRVYRPDQMGFMAVNTEHVTELLDQGCVLVRVEKGGR